MHQKIGLNVKQFLSSLLVFHSKSTEVCTTLFSSQVYLKISQNYHFYKERICVLEATVPREVFLCVKN
jgi:hypothetical protein